MSEAPTADPNDELINRAARLLGMLNQNPAARPHLENAIKALDPKIKTTQEQVSELIEPALAPFKALADEIKADREAAATRAKEETDAAAVAKMEAAFARLQRPKAQGGEALQEDGIEAVKRLMVDRNIADPDAAYALFSRQNPPVLVDESAFTPSGWNYDTNAVDDDIKGLFENPDRWADNKAMSVLTDMRKEAAQAA